MQEWKYIATLGLDSRLLPRCQAVSNVLRRLLVDLKNYTWALDDLSERALFGEPHHAWQGTLGSRRWDK